MLFSTAASADQVEYVVTGVSEPMLSNVRNSVTMFRIGNSARLNARLRRSLTEQAIEAATAAMRPFGYFHPLVSAELTPKEASAWLMTIQVDSGPPVLVQDLELELKGPGAGLASLNEWYANFPLAVGQVLNQQAWDKAKLDAMDILEEWGYMKATFSRHEIRVDPQANTARLELTLDTGVRAVMGSFTFNQDIVDDQILASLRRFKEGDPFHAFLLEKFRLNLWRTGYFDDIEIVERPELEADPPRVDFEVNFKPRKRNTFQGTIGYGTDTLARLQFFWGRHLLSSRGDDFDVGVGWQQRDNQFSVLANYRLPRKTDSYQFWIVSAGLKLENQTLEVSPTDDLENRYTIARGTVYDYWLKGGKTRVRNIRGGFDQFFETPFVQFLHEQDSFQPTDLLAPGVLESSDSPEFDKLLKNTSDSLIIGLDWDWPEIQGNGFRTVGHHERAWVFTSNKAWGSDNNFTQVYLSSRWNFLATDRLKFLLRAEAGYTDATNKELQVPIGDSELTITASDLPSLYRFKAGGSRSVRGYAYNSLDTNGLGSNNIFTASAEAEFRFHEHWSVAAFADVGNAFKSWSDPSLKLGTGFGLRWYSVIGALRLDFAQGWALKGDPWRIDLTIGTTLL